VELRLLRRDDFRLVRRETERLVKREVERERRGVKYEQLEDNNGVRIIRSRSLTNRK
jgi:hypothetical protein